MIRTAAIVSLGLLAATLPGCVYEPVPAPPPRPVVYAPAPAYYAPGYYAEPAYPAYGGYYGGPSIAVDIGGGRRGYGGRWR